MERYEQQDEREERDDMSYRIGQLSDEFDVTLRALRFYEAKGLLHPKRVGTTRLYSRGDRARLKLILLGKRIGLSLDEVKRVIDLYDPEGRNRTQLKAAMRLGNAQMKVLQTQRDTVETAITELSSTLDTIRKMLDDVRRGSRW